MLRKIEFASLVSVALALPVLIMTQFDDGVFNNTRPSGHDINQASVEYQHPVTGINTLVDQESMTPVQANKITNELTIDEDM